MTYKEKAKEYLKATPEAANHQSKYVSSWILSFAKYLDSTRKEEEKKLIDFTIQQIAYLLEERMEDIEQFFHQAPIDYDSRKTVFIEFLEQVLMKDKYESDT